MAANPATPLTNLAGIWLGPFQLVQLLGTGAMGAVYLAKDGVLRRDVAIKLIAKGGVDTDPERRDRFLREARAAARLIHPNVVQIFQVGEDAEFRFIAMEYVPGMTTAQAAKQHGGRLPEHVGIEKMRDAADALRLAESLGICHRDIKPANLLLTTGGALKIADFGLAAQIDGSQSIGGASTSFEGTPFYMSPEQWTGSGVGPPSDIYSLGCTFYHLLVGKTPFAARDLIGCFRAHCQAPIPDPKAAMPDVDPLLAELLKRCMAKQPQNRPTAGQIVEILDDMLMLRRSTVRSRAAVASISYEVSPAPPPAAPEVPSATNPMITPPTLAPHSAVTGTMRSVTTRSSQSSVQLSYHSWFNLTGYPFSDIRQPGSFWDAGPYAWALRTLASQLLSGQRPTMLVGEPGSGRTFLCEMVRNKFTRIFTAAIEPQLLFGTRLMVALCRQIGATGVDPFAPQRYLVEAFLAHILPRDRPEAIAAIVIDGVDPNEHDLLAELGEILQSAPSGKLGMVLVGSTSLPSSLVSSGAPSSLWSGTKPVVLPGMTPDEMVEYINFRMKTVGGSARGLELDIATQQLLHARSGGSPKLVNVFCHNALTIAALKQEPELRLSSIRVGMKSRNYMTPESAIALLRE